MIGSPMEWRSRPFVKEIGAVTNVDEATRQTQTTDAPSTRDRGRLSMFLELQDFGGKAFTDSLSMIFIYNTHSYDLE